MGFEGLITAFNRMATATRGVTQRNEVRACFQIFLFPQILSERYKIIPIFGTDVGLMATSNTNSSELVYAHGLVDYFQKDGHFKTYTDRTDVFLEQLDFELSKLGSNLTVLDVGCGHGIALKTEPQFEIAKRVGVYWGVEPDKSVQSASCFHQVWQSSLEDADIPDSSVDLAYCQMVLEHVEDPVAFLGKVAKVLKPNGVFLCLTVNVNSTFGWISSTCNKLGIQDAVLTIARGKQLVEDYHYPAVYRMCSQDVLQRLASQFGMSHVKVTLLEADEWLVYFPKGTRWAGYLLTNFFQRRVKNYSWMLARVQK